MNFYRDITFAAPSASLTNFPVLVRIRNERMKKRISSPNGYDVAFRQNGSDLAFDLDFYDSTTGTGAWWVRVPSLPSNAPSTIRMVYGDSSISTNQSSPATVWADYTYVYHFNDLNDLSSVVGSYTPSSTGQVSATTTLVPNELTGLGMRFQISDGYGDSYFNLTLGTSFNTTSGTISILSSTNDMPAAAGSRYMSLNTGWRKYRYNLSAATFTAEAGSASMTLTPAQANGFYCYGGSTNATEVGWSVNGVIQDPSSASPGYMRWDTPQMSATGLASTPTIVVFDEIRISTTTYKPAEWLQYEQNQMMNHTRYTTYGYEYHSDGTLVHDFCPWIHSSRIHLTSSGFSFGELPIDRRFFLRYNECSVLKEPRDFYILYENFHCNPHSLHSSGLQTHPDFSLSCFLVSAWQNKRKNSE